MEILQRDILGNSQKIGPEKSKKANIPTASKSFKEVSLADGLNEKSLVNDAMLILRILQRKMIYRGLNSKNAKKIFSRILLNELAIKSGKTDPATAVRDSLIYFYAKAL